MDKHEALDWFLRRRSMQLADKCQAAEDIAIDCIAQAIDAGWNNAKDRLPEDNKDVLIYGEWTGASGTKYRELFLSDMNGFIYQGYTPIAWMPLPEPPKEET